jgi:hypothetical protein
MRDSIVLPALPPKADIGSPCTKHEKRLCGSILSVAGQFTRSVF